MTRSAGAPVASATRAPLHFEEENSMHRCHRARVRAGLRTASPVLALAALAAFAPRARAQSINLQFSGSGNTLAATGFEAAYNLDPTGFNVTGGRLVMQTLSGDTFGDYENDP